METISFTPETKDSIIAERKKAGRILIEVQSHIAPDGKRQNNLVFDTKPRVEPLTLEQRIALLEAEIARINRV